MLHDGKAQARAPGFATPGGIHAIESLGHPRQMVARNAGAVIGHGDRHRPRVMGRADLNPVLGTIAAITNGIAQQIVEHLKELGAISADLRQFIWEVDDEFASRSASAGVPGGDSP